MVPAGPSLPRSTADTSHQPPHPFVLPTCSPWTYSLNKHSPRQPAQGQSAQGQVSHQTPPSGKGEEAWISYGVPHPSCTPGSFHSSPHTQICAPPPPFALIFGRAPPPSSQ